MSAPVENFALMAERIGSGTTVAISTAGITGGAMGWLDANQGAILALCALAGLAISAGGFAVHWYYQHKKAWREERRIRATDRRQSDRPHE